jgi:hypothetical protein
VLYTVDESKCGMLEITHKVRFKFLVASYVDIVDCDVAPV